MIKQKRVVVYFPEGQHQRLRAKLLLLGKTVSQWFREKAKEFLRENTEINHQLDEWEK